MADDADRADIYTQNLIDAALRHQAAQNRLTGEIGPELCVECFDIIPMARRKLGASLCIDCKEREERDGR